ncbi:MAG: hypothetical protein HY906_08740 [Deltaproteobacteria bacterium]|nr:hypothetical protein [Deltaproteobacteria bacterium]
MTLRALTTPATISVNRSDLRQRQSRLLQQARGRTVVVVSSRARGARKCVVDEAYFDELLRTLRAATETLAITTDRKLFSRLLAAAGRLDRDVRGGRLHSVDEAFGDP